MLEEWQISWKNGDTGRKIYNIMPSVSLRPTNWIREDVIFFSQHGPFPDYFKRFHLSDNDYCSCGGIGKALHCTTECIYTVSWHMRKPGPNFEQEWLKRVANNLVSRQKIRGIIKFIIENSVSSDLVLRGRLRGWMVPDSKPSKTAVYEDPVQSGFESQKYYHCCGVEVWRWRYRPRCRPRHVTVVQKHLEITLALFQNGAYLYN
ncbi:hypothetical protein AVEN_141072-1 [Araneus ventricosus]|uniref:Uncharacterized protein n=1 Tax=Araneus ventricosus TaxID=182803 RepID=A0A4Y2QT00_ARAVE|nr:hypothetical protein AVEN_141072-1 [Araneus ventricosus]